MMRSVKLFVIMSAALSLSACTWLTGWLGGKDNTEPPAPLTDIQVRYKIETLWASDAGSAHKRDVQHLQPLLLDDTVIIVDGKGRVSAFALSNGEQRWETEFKQAISAGVGGDVRIALLATEEGRVIALASDSGKELWQSELSSEILAAPQVLHDRVVVRSIDGRITGLDRDSGEVRWTYQRDEPVLTLRGTSEPHLLDELALIGLDNGRLLALNLDNGRLVWERLIAAPTGRSELERMVDLDADLQVSQGVIYATTFQGRVAAVAARSGELLWSQPFSSYRGLMANDKALFVTDDKDHVWSLDRFNGASLWKNDKLYNRQLTRPVILKDVVMVGDFDGYVHLFNQADGQLVGRHRHDSKGIASLTRVDDERVLVHGFDGSISLYRIQPNS